MSLYLPRPLATIKSALLFAFIVFLPFQDVGLANTPLGVAGASLSVIPLVMLLMIQLAEWSLQKDLKINVLHLWVVSYMIVVTTVYFASSGIVSYGENMVWKSIKLLILTVLFASPISFINYEKFHNIKYAVGIAFTLSCAGLLLPFLGLEWFDSNSMLHATPNGNMRPRGFALESSTLSIQIVTLGLLAMHFFHNRLTKALLLIIIVVILMTIESKGGVAVFGLTVFLSILLLPKTASWKRMLGIIVGVIIMANAFYFILDSVTKDLEEFSSTATRLTMAITTVLIAAHNPFGVGFSGYLPAISTYLPDAINLINLPLNYGEVSSYIAQNSAKNISAKTFLFNYFLFFGWPFVIGFILFFIELVRRVRKVGSKHLLAAILFSVLAISTYSDGLGLYNVSLVFGVAFNEAFRKDKFGNFSRLATSYESRRNG